MQLLGGVAQLASAIYGIHVMKHLTATSSDPSFGLGLSAMMMPLIMGLFVWAGISLGVCMRDWNGNPTRKILLFLADEYENKN